MTWASTGLVIDINGNVIANILPRTATSAVLKSLVGGQGELASATDYAAIYQFNGAVGAGTASEYSPMSNGVLTETVGTTTFSTATTNNGAISFYTRNVAVAQNSGSLNFNTGSVLTAGFQAGSLNFTAGNNTTAGVNSLGGGVAFQTGQGSDTAGIGAQDGLFYVSNSFGNISILSGTVIGNAARPIGLQFFGGTTPAPQPTLANTGGGTIPANVGVPLMTLATFNGIGSGSAYTINQIVAALKNLGLLAL